MFGFPHDRFQDAMLDRTDAVALRCQLGVPVHAYLAAEGYAGLALPARDYRRV
jgi:hypothetical protein